MEAQKRIAEAATDGGGEAYLVGGSVRDSLLGLKIKDYDYLVTGVPVETLISALHGKGFKLDLVGKSFGVIKATLHGETYDIALPRKERSTGAGHKDFEVNVDHRLPVEADLSRRDFTVNAIALRVRDNVFVDPFGGRRDLIEGVLRAVGSPHERFSEDPLRMMRAARFVAKLGFSLEEYTAAAIFANSHLIETVAPERIQEELIRLLTYENPESVCRGLSVFNTTGLFDKALKPHKFTARAQIKYEVIGHVCLLNGSKLARIAAFFEGLPTADSVMERLKFSNEMRRDVRAVSEVLSLLGDHTYEDVFRRAVAKSYKEEVFHAAVEVHEAILRQYPAGDGLTAARAQKEAQELRERFKALSFLMGYDASKVPVTGNEIESLFGVKGRDIGTLKKLAAVLVIERQVPSTREAVIEALMTEVQIRGLAGIRQTIALLGD